MLTVLLSCLLRPAAEADVGALLELVVRYGTRSGSVPFFNFAKSAFTQHLIMGDFQGDVAQQRRLQTNIATALTALGYDALSQFHLVHYQRVRQKLKMAAPTFIQLREIEAAAVARLDCRPKPAPVPAAVPRRPPVRPARAASAPVGLRPPRSLAGYVVRHRALAAAPAPVAAPPVAKAKAKAIGAPVASATQKRGELRRTATISRLKAKLRDNAVLIKALQKKLRKYIDKYGDWQKERADLKRQTQHQYYVTPKRKRGAASFRRLTVSGGYNLAIKRSFGHTGATASTGHLQLDLTRQRTVAWEQLLVANLMVQVRTFFQNAYMFLRWGHRRLKEELLVGSQRARQILKGQEFTYEIIVMRADATHTHCAEGAKAHSMEVRAVLSFGKLLDYMLALTDDELDAFDLKYCPGEYTVDLTCIPDIVKVPEDCDGTVSRALFLKQSGSLCVRRWCDPVLEDEPTLGFNAMTFESFEPCKLFHVALYLFGTDNGGDQQGMDTVTEMGLPEPNLQTEVSELVLLAPASPHRQAPAYQARDEVFLDSGQDHPHLADWPESQETESNLRDRDN